MAGFTVTRQIQWPDGTPIVEINTGSLDYANPGMLKCKYKGEGQTYNTLGEACEVALNIAHEWQKNSDEKIYIGIGNTHGNTMPFAPMELTAATKEYLRNLAEKVDSKLPRCSNCNDILGKERYGCHLIGEYDCCSAICAESYYSGIDFVEE